MSNDQLRTPDPGPMATSYAVEYIPESNTFRMNVTPAEPLVTHPVPNNLQADSFISDLFAETNKPPAIDETLLYVNRLESQTGKKLGESQYALFSGVTNKKEINKIFFGLESTYIKEKDAENTDGFLQIAEMLKNSVAKKRKEKIEELKGSIQYQLREADRTMMASVQYLQVANQKREELQQFEATAPDYVAQLAKIKQNPFWKLLRADPSLQIVEFLSGNVVLRYINRTHGTDYTVNLGTFILKWNVKRAGLNILPNSQNITIDGYAHPHIAGSGTPCWGTANHTVGQALLNQEISTVLDISQTLLHTYNPDSPYVRLEEFFVRANPSALKGDCEKRAYMKAWITEPDYDNEFPFLVNILEEENNDDGENRFLVQVYKEYNKKYGVAIDDKLYVRASNNRYAEISEDLINDWY